MNIFRKLQLAFVVAILIFASSCASENAKGKAVFNPVAQYAVTETPSQTASGTSSTALLFDISGSMDEQDLSGVTKLDSAKGAGARILDIIQAENSASQGAEVGILSFSDGAWVDSPLSADVNSARAALVNLSARNGTGMSDGLRLAIDQFQNKDGKPIIILLSDGMPNIGLGNVELTDLNEVRQQVLDLASEAGGKGICIYTVGFGVPNTVGNVSGEASIDEEFLKQVSANSGCGAYYNAQNATELANVYVNLRHSSTGTILLAQTGSISQGQTVQLGGADIAQGTEEMLFTLNWPGSKLDPSLVDPNGKIVDQNYPGAHFFQTKSLASVIIQNPIQGNWTFTALGVEVPEGIIEYNAVVSARMGKIAPQPVVEFPAILILVPLILGGLLTYIFVTSAKRNQKRSGAARVGGAVATLYIVSGQGAGRAVSIRDNSVIGRSRTSGVYVEDPSVSRSHARIRFSNGQWFIQDIGSSSGVYLNGARITASVLRSGDHIRVGSTELQFQQ
ncbi:MAG: FHA domain-containing protein [Anaerolineales bacterium]|nr:FHA domain-containing protein [Anaerolineales bacterium]